MINSRQERLFNFLVEYINSNQYPPSVREMCEGANIKSTSTVATDLKTLAEEGYIKKSNSTSRSIEILKNKFGEDFHTKEETIDIPLLGRVAAGNPITAVEDIEYYFPIPSYYGRYGELFMLEIYGESMIEAGILDGDKILVKKTNYADHGDVVVALIDDDATCKRLYKKNGQVMLIPENSSMEPIIPDNLIILGKVIALFRDKI